VILNFQGADIATVARAVGLIARRNFVIDPRVNGTVNIVSSEPVARELVYPIFLSALRLQGFAAVEANGFTKLVPEADAKLNSSPTASVPQSTSGDRIITQVIPLQYENAAQLLPVLRPLISPNNVINAYPNNNTLVITDYAENVSRMLKVIASIDVAPAGELEVITMTYASALDVASMIARLLPELGSASGNPQGNGQAPPRSSFTVDPRTNSLLVRSDNSATLARLRQLISKLDTPAAGTGNIHVVYLRNAEANKVADALHGIISGDGRSSSASAGSASGSLATSTNPLQGTGAGGGALGGGSQPAATSFNLPASQGGGVVEAYPSNNSLVIVAPDNVYNNLRAVIDKLDARRAQVFVEALVVEVSQTKADAMGIQWQALSGLTGSASRVIGGTNFSNSLSTNIITAAGNITSVGQGLNVGIVKGSITLPNGTTLLNLGALATFLQSQTDANILSTPNLLTIDNEEAKIVVGQNVPFITGSQTSTSSGLTNPFQTIERRDVGLTLRVKPTIAEGGTVKLAIYQEVSSIQDTTNAAGIITNKRSIESTVLVDDGQIVVLGGLIQDSLKGTVSKVPILGDLPVVGSLFRSDSRTHEKTNLMVFMRPVVLRDASSPGSLTADRYEFIRNEQLRGQPERLPILPDASGPVLPPYPEAAKP
jgi:general secretion pathway protein D